VVKQVAAYEAVLRIVEPEKPWFDLTLCVGRHLSSPYKLLMNPPRLSSYAFVAVLIGAGSYFAYLSFFPTPKKKKATKAPIAASTDAGASSPVVTPGSGVYEEEWIPEHHKKSNKGKKESGVLSSGDEKSGAESGADGKKKGSRRK